MRPGLHPTIAESAPAGPGRARSGSLWLALLCALFAALAAPGTAPAQIVAGRCPDWEPETMRRNPTEWELRCRWGAHGPGRFGLLSYAEVPVYQPRTPMPGTHVVGVPGHAAPQSGESFEEWEWRVLRTRYGREAQRVHREMELLDPRIAARVMRLEARLTAEGIAFTRLETWRSPARQAYLFQRGRSRPGALATATLTSWHSHQDERGRAAGRAADYRVAAVHLERFHQIAAEVGLQSFGADSNDPGHVFLPEPLPEEELILLRLLPRVAVVTLSTGRPVDELEPAAPHVLRAATAEFIDGPLIPRAAPGLAGAAPAVPSVRTAAAGGTAGLRDGVRAPAADGRGAPGGRR